VSLPIVYICVCSVLSLQTAAAEVNKSIDFGGLRVYGLLANLTEFKFYSYDPSTNQFCFDETIVVNNKRIDAFADMVDGSYLFPWLLHRVDFSPLVSNKIFSVVLSAYTDGLRARIAKSKDRAKQNTPTSSVKVYFSTDWLTEADSTRSLRNLLRKGRTLAAAN